MGGLSSGPGPGLCLLTLVVLIVAQQVQSAPVQEESLSPQSRAQGYYDGSSSELSTGCYYNFQHYGEGDRIITNEPCLNCTCHNRMLMCYLRVCPFTKAIGQNCTIEKKPGQCCPLIICPEVPVQLLTSSTTTEHSESYPHRNQLGYGQYGTAVGHLDDYGCKINGEFYTNGAQIPGNIDKPCEVCYCIRNRTACIMQECTLQVEGCIPVYEEGLCCPVRYQCDYEYNYNAITTEQPRPTPGLVLTTTTSGPFECQHDNKWYADGAMVETEDSCEHCYCMKGDIVCAVQECKPPFEKDGHNCTAMPPAPGKCCPDSYHCDGNEIVDESEPTFRQDRMHKFGQNNANITMSVTSSTSSGDKQHSWHYGASSNENEMPNRFTDEHDKDGTTKPGKPTSESDMMVTEGVPPTSGPLESGSHHIDGHGDGSGTRPTEGQSSTGQGHGVNTDNMLTISQVIHSIVQNQTNLLNQNRVNQTGKPDKPSQHDDKIVFPTDLNLQKTPGMDFQTDEDGNPIETQSGTTEFPNEYYGLTGSVPNIYAQQGGRPQKRPTTHKRPGAAGSQGSAGQPVSGETQDLGGHKRPGMTHTTGDHGMTQHPQKKPIIHKQPGMAGTLVVTDDEGNPIEIYEGATGRPEMASGQPGSSGVYSTHGEKDRPKQPGMEEGFTGRPDSDGVYTSLGEYGKPHKKPTTHKKPGDVGGDVSGSHDFSGKPGIKQPEIFGEHGHTGRPHGKPVTHKKPGTADEEMVTETYEDITGISIFDWTGEPVTDKHGHPLSKPGSGVMTDEDGVSHGRPQKIPSVHKKPGGEIGEDDVTEGYESVTETTHDLIDSQESEHGFTGRPSLHKKPGSSGSPVFTADGKPVTDSHGHDGEYVYYDKYGKPHKRPDIHKRPGSGGDEGETYFPGTTQLPDSLTPESEGQDKLHAPGITPESDFTDDDGNPIEETAGLPDADEFEIFYDKYGRPHKRPTTVHKTPTGVMTDEHGKPVDGVAGITELPEGVTGKPEQDGYQIFYDQYGRPHKRPVTHKKPGEEPMTDEHSKPVDGMEDVTEYPEGFTGKPGQDGYQIFYDQHGRPHKRPITHKKPVDGVLTDEEGKPVDGLEGVTEFPEGFTGKPGTVDGHIYFDEHGRPLKRPVTHKKPVSGVLTDEEGKPVDGVESVTDLPEGFTGKPEQDGYQIFYDQHGRPHKRPVTHKKPVPGVLTDEHGEPIDGVEGGTDFPEGFTGKPEQDGYEIFYDKHGRPHRRPVTHKKPGDGVLTDEEGKPVDGVEGVTGYPEGFTGKPDQDGYQIFYDQHGRPHKRPVTQKKPVLTDENGEPIDGMETVTDFPEGFTGKPGLDDYQIFYDQFGRPHKRPVTHKKPGSAVLTDEDGNPLDGFESVTDLPEGFTGKPDEKVYQIFYDQHGRPHKRPVTHKKPVSGVLTDEHGKPIDGVEGVTDIPEGFTGKPEQDGYEIFFDKHGRPHRRPVTHKKPGDGVLTDEDGKPVDEAESVTDMPEGFTGKPEDNVYQIYYDQYGRPFKRPVTHKKPVPGVMTDEHGKPVDGVESVTDLPEGFTGKPGSEDEQIFFDEHGRPHKRPVTHKKPVSGVLTDEEGKPIDGVEGVTDLPEGFTGKPDQVYQIFYDEHGRPHKKPVTHKKPGEEPMTDEHGKPVHGVDGVTEYPEGVSGKPDQIYQIYYDQYGRPHKRPITHKKPGDGVLTDEEGNPIDGLEGVTEFPEGFTGKPDQDGYQIFYDQHGRPHKRPVTHKKPVSGVLTDEDGKPADGVEGVTDIPEGFTGKPGTEDGQIFYDEHGRPHKRPVTHKKPVPGVMTDEHREPIDGVEDITDLPEGVTGKPDQEVYQIFYDQYGRPHKRPVTHKKPGEEPMTDEHGKPVHGAEGVTEYPEGFTGKPGTEDEQIYFDEHGRPHKRPVTHKKPVSGVFTDEHGKPVDGVGSVSDLPEGVTGKPGTEDEQILYDEHGRPHKRPVTHKKPVPGVMTDEHGEPVEGVEDVTDLPEGVTGKPDQVYQIFYDEHGRPHKRPVTHKKPVDGVMTDDHGKPIDGVEGITDLPEGFTGKPEQDRYQIFYDQYGRPHKRPITHKKPVDGILTDELGKPVDGVEGVTEYPEGFTGKPGTEDEHIFFDEHGRPHKRPEKPVSGVPTDEDGNPVDGVEGVTDFTDLAEGFTGKPEQDGYEIFYDKHGRPHRRPVTHKKPGTDGDMLPETHDTPVESVTKSPGHVDGVEHDDTTDDSTGHTGKPGQVLPGPEGAEVVTHGAGASPEVHESTTITSEKEPGSPTAANATTNLEEPDVERPHKPGSAVEGIATDEGDVESYPGTPEKDIHPTHDVNKVMAEKPLPHSKPEEEVMTSEKGQTHEVTIHVPGEQTDKHHGTGSPQVSFDEDGRPHEKPGVHKKPGENATTEEKVKPGDEINIITEIPEGVTSKPESDSQLLFYDQYGRPHRRPVTHKKPGDGTMTDEHGKPVDGVEGVTDLPEGFTGKPGTEEEQIFYDEHGRPHKKPVTHKKPVSGVLTDEEGKPVDGVEGVTDFPEGFTGKPDQVYQIFYDEHGRPHKRPVTHKKPGEEPMTDETGKPVHGAEGVTEHPEGFTGKPGTEDEQIFYDEHGRPHKKPVTHKKPVPGVLTDEDGNPLDGLESVTDLPEGVTGKPDQEAYQIFYDQYGRPHKRPVIHKKPVSGVLTDQHGKPVDGVESVTDLPEGVTGKPGTEDEHIFFDEHGRPHKRPEKPVSGILTDEDGKPIDGVEGVTDLPEGFTGKPDEVYQIFYDEHGRPHKRPVTHKKPVDGVMTDEHGKPVDGLEGVTEFPEGFTGKPGTEDEHIFYDEHDRPHKRPVTHKKPVSGVLTDEEGKPVDGVEGVTEYPEGFNEKPDQVYQIFYDEHGRPHKRPVTHKKPGEEPMTDEHGKPVDEVESVTGLPEGFTGKPGTEDEQIFYDEHGRPHKKPVTHKKPVPGVMTDEHGEPVDGVESVTDLPEGVTGKPDQDGYQIFYDQHGRPHKRPVTHKKPIDGVMTDEHGKPIDGVEDITEFPEGFTGKPGTEDGHIYFDEHGRPHKRPVTHKKPGDGVMTDESGEPVEKHTEKPDSGTQEVLLDPYGRPVKKPVTPTKPESTETDEEHEETTEPFDGATTMPESVSEGVMYDNLGRPQKKPGMENVYEHGIPHGKPQEGQTHDSADHGHVDRPHSPPSADKQPSSDSSESLPEEGESSTKEPTEADDSEPGVEESFFGETGRPQKKPVLSVGQKRPGSADTTEGPVLTDTVSTEAGEQIFYDEHGQPHKKPVTDTRPSMTDESESQTVRAPGAADSQTAKPESDKMEIYYDKYGKPHKRPITHVKPDLEGTQVLTDDIDQRPIEKDTTETPEEQSTVPDKDKTDLTDQKHKKPEVEEEKPGHDTTEHGQDGLPQEKPDSYPKPAVGDMTEKEPDHDGLPQIFDEHGHTGRPQKIPSAQEKPMPGEDDSLVGLTTELPETGETDIMYDKYGRPHKRPTTVKKPQVSEDAKPDGPEGITDEPEVLSGKPGTDGQQIYHDPYGRPQKKPVTHDKPGETVTGEHDLPHEGMEVATESLQTDRPEDDTQEVSYDEHGRPYKRPVVQKKPGDEGMIGEDEKPHEEGDPLTKFPGDNEVTDTPEGFTGIPGTEDEHVYYDELGRPHKRPVTHKKPVPGVMTDEEGKPVDGEEGVTEYPEGVTGKPDQVYQIFYDEHGRPHKRPVTHKKPGEEPMTDEHGKPVHGVDGVTEYPEGFTGKPGTEDEQIFYDEHGRPHKRPVTHKKPVPGVMTDEDGNPLDGLESVTDLPEGFTGKPDQVYQIFYDEHGRPHKRPVTHKKPVSGVLTDEHGKPVDGVESVTDLPEGVTGKPGTEDEHIFFDEHGRPHKRPEKPVSGVLTDEDGNPVDGVEGVTDLPEGFTGKPEQDGYEIFYDKHGRPHRRPVTHKKPGTDGDMLPETHDTPVESVTKSPGHVEGPEHDDVTEIMFGYGYTGAPDQEPGQFIPGPEGISTTEKVGSMTKSPESTTAHSPEAGKPDDVGETSEHGKPHEGGMEPLEGQTKKPEHDGTSEVHGGPVHHGRPEGKPQSPTKPSEHDQPEHDDKHPVDDYEKPSDHLQPGVTEESGAAGVEDLTETPHSGDEDQLMIFGEPGHTGRPHKRPVKPTVPGTSESENIPEGKPEAPVTSQAQDLPVDGTPIHKIPDVAEDHEATDEKKPELESDVMATTAPEKATTDDKDQVLHQKPETEEPQVTGDVMGVSDKGTTLSPDQHEQKKPIAHPDEGAVPVEERPEGHSPDESVTEKFGDDATEIYYDSLGQPHKRPVHPRPSGTDHMPETGVTDLPTVSGEDGLDDDQHKPLTTSTIGGTHSTEGPFDKKPDEMAKPGSADGDEKKPEFDEGEPTHVSHPEKPQKKPVLKPGLDTTGVAVDEPGQPETGAGLTEVPEAGEPQVHHEEMGSKPSKKPTTQEVKEGQESTTKLPSGAVHDSKVPGVYDGQTPVDHKPEENEIFGVPEKDVAGIDEDSVTKVPEVPVHTSGKLPTSQKKPTAPSHDSEDGHTGSSGTAVTPEGDQAGIDEGTATEEDDESLVITTDESEEDETEVHAKPESDAEGKPFVTTPKIPSHIVPGQQGSTPGLGSESHDFTTPASGAHDASGVPVTEKDGAVHVTSGKPEEHLPGMSTGFDDSKPEDVTTPKGISDTLSSTTGQVVSEEDHAKPADADKTSAPTGSTPVPVDDGEESHVPEKDLNKVSPGGISETTVGHEDTHPGLSPTQETDGVTSPDASGLPEVITPVSTPEGTHGVPESTGSVPSGEMHPVVSSTVETPGKVPETKPALHQPPQIFIPYLPPDDGSSTKHPILIDEALHESSAPFDDIINNLANILRPSQTTEEPEGTTEVHGDVPGEGSCFMDGVTYQHNEEIPPLNPCHTKCTCVSSIIHCLSLKCPPPPEDVSNCTVVHEENSCCPIYVCGTDVSPTIPVENHEEEATTYSSADKDESATVHGYEPSKPTKSGDESQKPEVTESDDGSHTDQETPIKHETDDKTSQESKPGVAGESKKPQVGSEVPEESDKGTLLTERPEEDSVDETHPSQGMDHVMPTKPESPVIETSTESKIPTKTTEVSETPETAHIRPGAPQSGYHPIPFDDKHPSTVLPIYFGTEIPYQTPHKPESVDHVLDTDKPDQEGVEPTPEAEGVKPQEEEQKPGEMDGSKPDDFSESATHRPVHHGTTKPVGGLSPEGETPEKDTAGEVEPLKPTEDEKETEPSKPHEHDETETETDVHPTLEGQEPIKKPDEKPDEITSSKGKPQSGQEPAVTGEESEHQTTERPGDKEPQFHTGTSQDEEMVHGTSMPHEKPGMGDKPSDLDVTPGHTTVEPHGQSPVTEESDTKHQSTEEPENDFVESSSQKPGLHESPTPDLPAESDPSVKRPVSHDKPSEGEEHKPTSALDADRPMEASETQKPGQPTSEVHGTETTPTEADVVSADKTHPSVSRPTYDAVNEDEEPSKKPEESTDEPNQTLAHSTTQPVDDSESGKPYLPSGDVTDMHKKPQPGHDGAEDTFVTSEGPHKEFSTEMYPSPVSEDSENITPGTHEETPEETPQEHEDSDEKHPSVHPPAMDNESAVTTEEPSAEDKKPQGKPETEVHPTLTDDKSTAKPDEEQSEVEHSQTKPESGEGLVVRPTEDGTVVKKPTVSEKPVFGEKVPQGEQDTDLVHATTESQVTDGKPDEAKPQHGQDFSSTVRPKPTGVHGVSGQGGLQTDDIPEEVLLHPTRMPGFYETERPDLTPEVEEDGLPTQKPHTEDDNLATIFPQGIIRPITKRPVYGTGKPVVSDNKQSTTPGYPFIHLVPETDQISGEPEEPFEVTTRPIFDIITGVPEDFAQIFGIKPSTVHGQQPDKDGKPEHTTHTSVPDFTTGVPDFKPQTVDHVKRPIHTTNGTHFIQYVPYKEGEVPTVPEGATLGELIEKPDGQKYWPIIYMKMVTTTPGAETSQMPFKPIPQQVFNETHFIQYVPYDKDEEPEVPEGAALGQPQKGPDNQLYWPIIGKKPITVPVDKPVTEPPYPGQVFNGTHFIQYVPFREGQKPEVPEEAVLGEPENAPNGQKYWPIISTKPIPEDDTVTSQSPVQSQPEQIFNGTHFIQFAPYNDGQEPEIPEEATLGQPQKGPDGQVYWPIIDTKPLPVIPEKVEPATEQPFPSVQVFNGTNFIQYVPFKDGLTPEVPEGATLGQPQKGPDGQIYWPIIYMRPRPVKPQGSFPEQVYNGTNFIQYVPYEEGRKPEVPSHATLGEPQKAPDGQMYWPIIYMKPTTVKPEDEKTTERPFQAPVFNGTHFIQYVPYMEGFEPDIPEEATLGKPEKRPDGETYWPIVYNKLPTRPKPATAKPEDEKTTERPSHVPVFNGTHFIQYVPYMEGFEPDIPEEATLGKPEKRPDGETYWPIIYHKLPTRPKPERVPHYPGQFFNGTHFVQYLPYRPSHKPQVPEGVTLSQPQKGPDGQMYWMIVSTKPFPAIEEKPIGPQFFNGTHFIQYVPYEKEKEPDVPEGATLGRPEVGAGGQQFWPIIYMRPIPGIPITYQKPLDQDQGTPFDPFKGQPFNGTHYVQYIPYEPGKTPNVPEGAAIGQPTKRPNGQLYWPIYYLRPIQGTPVQGPMFWSPYDSVRPQPEQVFNGTHFIQYLPYNPTRMPEVPEGATLGQPQKGPEGQMYWVIISDKPLPAQAFNDSHVVQYVTPVTPEQAKPQTEQNKPIQVFNGTHYIQYVPYTPGQKPVLPEGASLGQPTQGPEGQMYWPIIYMKPQPGKPAQQVPIFWGPSHDHLEPVSGQIFNGTHYIRYVKYDPSMRPIAPEGATISEPQRRPDGQLYWVIASKKPLFDTQVPVQQHPGQIFNGTHYIQYVPYNSSQMPQVPEGAILGHPQKGPEGQMYWVIISDKPLPAQPGTQYVQYVTPVTPEDEQMVPGPMFNGTHFIQYVPYKMGHIPKIPQDAVLGELYRGPGGQMYWPIIYRKPPQSFNGTHYIQHVPDSVTGVDSGKPSTGTHHIQPVNATSKPAEDHPFWSYGQYAPRPGNGTLPTVSKYPGQKPGTEEHAFWTYGHDKPKNGSEDSYPYKPTTEYPSWSSGQIQNATKVPEISKMPSGQYGGSDHSKPGYEYDSGYYKPEKPERPSTPEDSYEGIDEDHLIEYPSGSDYDETQEQPYGPGTCRYAGKVYVSAQQIPRDDPCDFCFCFRSDIICLQQSCPPPIPGCHEEPIQGFCCPRYECHVRMATLLNVTSTTTTTTTTLPPHFLSHVYKGAAGRTGCFIQGKAYRVGQAIPSASGPCMDCMCGGDGKMKCEPKVCTPEPMVRQMMVSSEKPTTANHR